MKRRMILGFVLVIMLVVSGCAGDPGMIKGPEETNGKLDAVALVTIEPAALESLSEDAKQAIEDKKGEEGSYLFEENGRLYLAVFAGECPTGGYRVGLKEVFLDGEEVFVRAELTQPGPDMMVTDALTYPLALVELQGLDEWDGMELSLVLERVEDPFVDPEEAGDGYYVSATDDYAVGEVITVGEIMQFDGAYIHIITGDLVQVYKYNQRDEASFYLGQSVQLVKTEEGNKLEPFIIEDFSVRHTNMGQMVFVARGEVTAIDDGSIAILSDGAEMTFKTYAALFAEVGDQVEIHYMNFGDTKENSLIALYNEVARLEMTIREIHRTDEGEMILYTSDSGRDTIDYHVYVSGGTTVDANYSQLQPGDQIDVFAEVILESDPAQVTPSRIIK